MPEIAQPYARAHFGAQSFNRAVLSAGYAAIAIYIPKFIYRYISVRVVINNVPSLSPGNFMGTIGVIDINPSTCERVRYTAAISSLYE